MTSSGQEDFKIPDAGGVGTLRRFHLDDNDISDFNKLIDILLASCMHETKSINTRPMKRAIFEQWTIEVKTEILTLSSKVGYECRVSE